jgi:hypothetical protein
MSDDLIEWGFIGLGVGIYLFYKGFSWFKLKRLIENTPTSKIRSLAMGLVEIYGSVVPYQKKLLKSPLTDSDCVYYSYRIEVRRGSGKNRHWATIKKGSDSVHFNLKDDTGSVLVDSKGAKVDIPPNLCTQTYTSGLHSRSIKSFLEKSDIKYKFLGLNKNMRFTEYHIAPKDKLYILGSAGDNPFVENATAQKNEDDIMIQKGDTEKVFYISDSHETKILKSLKWKTIGGFFGGGALIVVGLAIIFLYFGIF